MLVALLALLSLAGLTLASDAPAYIALPAKDNASNSIEHLPNSMRALYLQPEIVSSFSKLNAQIDEIGGKALTMRDFLIIWVTVSAANKCTY